jgi:hypothetical protein
MAKTIPQLTDATTVNAADELIIQQGGITKRATRNELMTFTASGTTSPRLINDRLADAISVKDFGASPSATASANTTAIQAAIDAAYSAGGGEVFVPNGTYQINATITLPQRVFLVGAGAGFADPYVSTARPAGTTLFLATGSNCDMIQATCRLTNDGGTLRDTNDNASNVQARHCGGIRNITLWGNRSTTPTLTDTSLNSSGSGLRMMGVRNFQVFNVFALFFAEHGLVGQSRNYGTGTLSCNNVRLIDCTTMNNTVDGINFSVGDSSAYNLNCGNNGRDGIAWFATGTLIGGQFWNNTRHGVNYAVVEDNFYSTITGATSYDNGQAGFVNATAGRSASVVGCVGRGNGRDSTAAALFRSNFVIGSSVKDFQLVGCLSYPFDQDEVAVTQYGFYVNNTTHVGVLEGSVDFGSASSVFVANPENLKLHGGLNTSSMLHPAMKMAGRTDVSANALDNVGRLGFSSWATLTSAPSNTIAATASSLITLNISGATTITDITYGGTGLPIVIIRNISSDSVTFTHNSAKLRCANATDVVLGQSESVMFVYVSGTAWQQVGGAY